MKTIVKKVLKDCYEDILYGRKSFEVLKKPIEVADQYDVGDILAINELEDDILCGYTGRCLMSRVTYILDDPAFCKQGFVILSLEPVSITNSLGCKIPGYANG